MIMTHDILLLIGQQRGKNVAPRRLLPRAAHQSQQGIQPPRILVEVTTVTKLSQPQSQQLVGSVGLGIVGTWNHWVLSSFFSTLFGEPFSVNSQSSSEPEKKKMKGRNLGLDPRWVPQML